MDGWTDGWTNNITNICKSNSCLVDNANTEYQLCMQTIRHEPKMLTKELSDMNPA